MNLEHFAAVCAPLNRCWWPEQGTEDRRKALVVFVLVLLRMIFIFGRSQCFFSRLLKQIQVVFVVVFSCISSIDLEKHYVD